jgi:hypothetical protein
MRYEVKTTVTYKTYYDAESYDDAKEQAQLDFCYGVLDDLEDALDTWKVSAKKLKDEE